MSDMTIDTQEGEKSAKNAKKLLKSKPRSAGRPRQDEVEERTQQLLQTAIDLFLEHGYAGVSLDTIAKAAHVTTRTIYVKFGGKAGLFGAAITSERERTQGGKQNLDADFRPMSEVLYDFGRRTYNTIASERTRRIQRVVIAESKAHPDLARAFFDAGPALGIATLVRYFSRPDIRAQLRSDIPLETLAIHLISCLRGDHLFRLLIGMQPGLTPADNERHVEMAISLFLSGSLTPDRSVHRS